MAADPEPSGGHPAPDVETEPAAGGTLQESPESQTVQADGGPATTRTGAYSVVLSRQARRNLNEHLPLEVAIAATETIQHAIAINPYRAGKPLNEPFDGYHSARRGTYRIIYRIDEPKHVVEIHSIRHRRDAYRT
jgi:mRNA interferase RelE/StbE